MRKLVLLLIVFALAGLLAYKLFSGKDAKTPEIKDRALRISKNSAVFNTAFTELLNDYYSLKDAFVEWDTVKADQAAFALAAKADKLPLTQLKADSNIIMTAQSMAVSVQGDAKSLLGDVGIEAKRRDFNNITDHMYNLIRTVRYDGETIYHIRCPMAFNDSEEGFWLSNESHIINPYLGKKHPIYKAKMLGCGEIIDSLDLVVKDSAAVKPVDK